MITVLLTILKIIGIILLCVLLTFLCVLLLVLFVPVRYRIEAVRREGEEAPFRVALRVTWLLHILNAAFCYPGEDGLRVRVLGFRIFPPRQKETEPRDDKTEDMQEEAAAGQEEGKPVDDGEVTGGRKKEMEDRKSVV